MSKEKPNYYAIIPAEVRYDNNLKANEKLLYAEITALSNKEGYCWSSNNYFADLFDVTPQTVSTWISNLKDKGHLERKIIRNDKKQVLKRKLIPIKDFLNTSPKNDIYPIKENVKGNNTRVNTTRNNNTSNNMYPALSKLPRKSDNHRKYPDKFEKLWELYPKRQGAEDKGSGYAKFRARVNEGIDIDTLTKAVKNYEQEQKNEGNINTRYVMQMKKFFGAKDIWLEYAEKEIKNTSEPADFKIEKNYDDILDL